jgi:hypothetical protein
MNNFKEWLAFSPLASALRVFVAVLLTLAVADWGAGGSIDFGAWETWVIAALASTVPMVVRWVNPADIEFGRGSESFEPFDVFDEED